MAVVQEHAGAVITAVADTNDAVVTLPSMCNIPRVLVVRNCRYHLEPYLAVGQYLMLKRPNSPVYGSSFTTTEPTFANLGPRRHHSIILAMFSSGPSKTASTLPFGKFRTQPRQLRAFSGLLGVGPEARRLDLAGDDYMDTPHGKATKTPVWFKI